MVVAAVATRTAWPLNFEPGNAASIPHPTRTCITFLSCILHPTVYSSRRHSFTSCPFAADARHHHLPCRHCHDSKNRRH